MIQLFKKIRQELLVNQKIGKYLLYAIGEVLLVVVGILIAIAFNNRNEETKIGLQLETYRKSLVEELNQDIDNLKNLKNSISQKKKSIYNYVDYYNTNKPKTVVLTQKMDSINWSKSAFYTNTYTIEDLITTGGLALFPKDQKKAILRLKNLQERYFSYETQTIENIALYDLELKKNTDLLFFNGYSHKQHQSVRSWKNNPDSYQFRILNNTFAESLKLYDFQEELYTKLITETQLLLHTIKSSENLDSKLKN